MSTIQKNITLQVNHPIEKIQPGFDTITPADDCDINIQVANGWAITGHYRNQALQSVTLHKTSSKERNYHG